MANLLHAAQVSGINSLKDGTIKLSLELQELEPNDAGTLYSMRNQLVKFYMTTTNIKADKIPELDSIEIEDEGKSPSKRMRNVFFRIWEQDNAGYEDFNMFYRFRMNQLIEKLKDKLV